MLKAHVSRSYRPKGGMGSLFPWRQAGIGSFGTENTNIGLEIKSPGFKFQLFYVLLAV